MYVEQPNVVVLGQHPGWTQLCIKYLALLLWRGDRGAQTPAQAVPCEICNVPEPGLLRDAKPNAKCGLILLLVRTECLGPGVPTELLSSSAPGLWCEVSCCVVWTGEVFVLLQWCLCLMLKWMTGRLWINGHGPKTTDTYEHYLCNQHFCVVRNRAE